MAQSSYWNRFWRRRVSRRALLGAGAVTALGAASAAVVGCSGGGDDAGGTRGGATTMTPGPDGELTPVAGGNITQGRPLNVLGVDPHIDLTGLDLDMLMYAYLYSWNRFTEEAVFNNLAESLEIPDPLHFNFKLRRGMKNWPVGPAAGEELTSEDCVASFLRRGTALTAPDKRYPQRFLPENGGKLEAPDPYTFNIELAELFVPALREMSNPTWAIIPKKAIDAYGLGLSQKAFGSGPFMLEEFRGSERIVLRRHPEYFLNPKPWLDSINIIVILENSSLLAAFESGRHQISGAIITRTTAEKFEQNEDMGVISTPSLFYPVIHMKMRPPWTEVRVREAFDIAINRDEIISVIQDGEGNYNGPIQWPQLRWALPQQQLREFYRWDPQRARQLLEEAGHKRISTRMKAPELTGPSIFGDMAQLIQNQVRDLGDGYGFDVELDFVELGAYITSVILPGNFDTTFFPNLPYDEPDRPLSFYHSRGVTGNGNWTNYSNPELDKLIDAQAVEFDEEKRLDLVMRAQRMILPEHGPQLTLTGGIEYYVYWDDLHFGPAGPGGVFAGGMTRDPEDDDYGPFGSEIWTEKA